MAVFAGRRAGNNLIFFRVITVIGVKNGSVRGSVNSTRHVREIARRKTGLLEMSRRRRLSNALLCPMEQRQSDATVTVISQ